jgi:hypothetical protein
MSLLSLKLISMSDGDAGQTIATLAYTWDALRLIGSFPSRLCVLKHHGRVVWNNAQDKDGWRTISGCDWMVEAHALITERIQERYRADYDKDRGAGAYDQMIAAMDLKRELERENQAAAASVRT